MAQAMDFRGQYVLVTGASSGLGLEMAKDLASRHGANLILVARRRERLEALRDELQASHGTRSVVIAADMTRPDDVERVFREATDGRDVYGVILNAGVTYFGEAFDQPFPSIEAMISTNVTSLVRLTSLFGPYLVARKTGGGILLVSSLAGFTPMPYQAVYGATKAFVTSYGQALAEELGATGVSVSVFAPGGIATEMLENSGLQLKFKPGTAAIMNADHCARLAIDAFRARKPLYVPGGLNKLSTAMMKVAPRQLVVKNVAYIYRGALPRKPA